MGKDKRFRSSTHLSPGPGQYSPDLISSIRVQTAKTMNSKLNQTVTAGGGEQFRETSRSFSKKGSRKSMAENEGHLFGTHYNRMHYFP